MFLTRWRTIGVLAMTFTTACARSDQSGLLMTLPHFSTSSSNSLLKSAGLIAIGALPSSERRDFILGSARTVFISLLSVVTISRGVFRGAPTPVQKLASYPGKNSSTVGMSGGYQGAKAAEAAAKTGSWIIEIVKRLDTAVGFEVLPKRWIVERTLAWISRCRRLTRDFERYARTVAAFIRLAMIRIMLRRLTRSNPSR